MGKDQYLPVRTEEEEKGIDWNSSSEIIPTNTRGFITYLSILLISLIANIFLLLHHFPRSCPEDLGRSAYSGITFDTLLPFHSFSEYWDPNINRSVADKAWDELDTNPVAVALHDGFAKEVGLAPSTRFPWDTERSIYYIKGFHALHCLKIIRKAIIMKETREGQKISTNHVFHCLDGLRQDIMCLADDTPMPASREHHVGDRQVRRCRNWGNMEAWATRLDQHACHKFDDYREATNTLELFAFCPEDSPYRPIMKAYFDYHGHKDPYEGNQDE